MSEKTGKAEAFFANAGKKIDELLKKVKTSDLAEKVDLESRIKEIKRNKEKLEKDFKEFSEDNKETFSDIAESLEESVTDLKNIVEKRFKKKKKEQ